MSNTINLRRPDGSIVEATPEQAARLQVLGYTPEGTEEATGRVAEAEEERFYSTPLQKVATAAEGIASGISGGTTDFILDSERSRGRAEHNPGIRLASQLAGAIAPAIVTGGTTGAVAAVTPAGALARGSVGVASRLATSATGRAAVAAGIEGAVSAAGSEAGRAHLSGDPLTAESVISAAGWGGVFGMGLGATASVLAKGSKKMGERLVREAALERDARLLEIADKRGSLLADEAYSPLRSALTDMKVTAKDVIKQADEAAEAAAKAAQRDLRAASRAEAAVAKHAGQVDEAGKRALTSLKEAQDEILSTASLDKTVLGTDTLTKSRKGVLASYKAASKAVEDGNPDAIRRALSDYRTAIFDANKKLGYSFDIPGVNFGVKPLTQAAAQATQEVASASTAALKDVTALRGAMKELDNFPKNARAFLGMDHYRAERVFAAMDQVLSGAGGPEMDAFRKAVQEGADHLMASVGVKGENTGANGLREAWKSLRVAGSEVNAARTRAILAASNEKQEKLGLLGKILRQASSRGASAAARKAGGGSFLSSAAYQGAGFAVGGLLGGPAGAGIVAEVTGLRHVVQQTLRQSVAKYGPGASRGLRRVAPQTAAIAIRLDGSMDDEKDRSKLFKARSEEIRQAAPAARDTLFRAVQPLEEAGEGEFAQALHASASSMIEKLMQYLPRDPGDSFSAGQSLWEPDPVEVETFNRMYEVFQDPLGVVTRALSTADVTPQAATALREFYPTMFAELQFEMSQRLSDPEFAKKLDFDDQANLSNMLDLDLHSCFRSDWIEEQQEMFATRTQPASAPTQQSASPGRPSAVSSPTKSQSLTER